MCRVSHPLISAHGLGLARGCTVVAEYRNLESQDLSVEASLVPGLLRQGLGAEPQLVGVVPRDAPLLGDALDPDELRHRFVPGKALGNEIAGAVHDVHAKPDVAHQLHTARDADIDRAALDQRADQVVRLLTAAALDIDRRSGRRVVIRRLGEPGVAGDVVRLFASLGHTATKDLIDVLGRHPGLVDHGALHLPEQGRSVETGKIALPHFSSGNRATYRFDDDGFRHGMDLVRVGT